MAVHCDLLELLFHQSFYLCKDNCNIKKFQILAIKKIPKNQNQTQKIANILQSKLQIFTGSDYIIKYFYGISR